MAENIFVSNYIFFFAQCIILLIANEIKVDILVQLPSFNIEYESVQSRFFRLAKTSLKPIINVAWSSSYEWDTEH